MKASEFVTEAVKQRLDPKCWKGKHKEGTKIKGGVRVNNCVPNESINEFAPGGGSISPPTKPPKNDDDRWEDDDDDDWHPRKRTEEDLHNPLGDQIKTLLKKKAKIVWYPWADREQSGYYRTQAVIRQITGEQIIGGRHIVFFKYCWRPWYKTAKGMEQGKSRCERSQIGPDGHKWYALVPIAPNTYELQNLSDNPDWKDPRSPEEIERDNFLNRGNDLDEASKQGVAEGSELSEEFDLIESIIESIADHNGVDAEMVWEDLESLTEDELYAFAVTSQLNEDWQKVNKKDKTDGMSKKAVSAYRREHPGSKLKTAVTTKPSKLKKGSKASKRRKSYCSRSKGQMKMHNISCAKTPDKALCKARRRWNC